MTDIEYWDGELTSKMAELEQSIGSLKSLFGGDKEAVRARAYEQRRGWHWVWNAGNEHGLEVLLQEWAVELEDSVMQLMGACVGVDGGR